MSLIQFIHLISITVYAGLAAYILTRNPKDRLVRISALYLLCFLVWSISYFLAHNPNISIGQTKLLYNLGSFGWLPFSSAFVWVVFMMTGKEKMLKNKIFRLVSFSIPVLLMYPAWSGKLLTDFVKQPFGWSYNWSLNVWTYLFFAYISVFMTTGLLVLYGYAKREKDVRKKGPAWLLFLATVIATPLGVMTNIVAQLLKLYEIPPMASDVALIWAVCLVYAIVRYEFLAVTPAAAAKNIISTMTDSLILLDEKGKISTVNSATCDLLGYEKEELIGKDLTSLFSSHSIGKLNVTGEEFIGLIEEGTFTGRELTYLTKEGGRLPVLLSASVIRNRSGVLRGIIVLARDITDIKKTEEELRGLNEQLKENERAVLNVLSDLEKSHEELKSSQEQLVQSSKMASIGRLVSDMAHEVNNPLMIISGRAQLSLMDAKGDKELEGSLGIIMDQCARAKDIIQRLLTFSKPSKGELKEAGVNDSVEFVVKLIEHQFSLTKVKIVKDYTPEDLKINIDEKQMHEVFMNLLKNAQDAMPEGGTITITTSKEVSNARIDFKDTGSGMAEEDLEKAFDPFFTTKDHGTGLGLSVCYGIVHAHGGELKYSSEPGKGTTATILLPTKQ